MYLGNRREYIQLLLLKFVKLNVNKIVCFFYSSFYRWKYSIQIFLFDTGCLLLELKWKELIVDINFTLWNSPIFSRTEPVSRIGMFSIFLKELFLVFHSVDDSVLVSIAIFVVCPEDDMFSDSTSLLLLRGDSRLSLHSAYWDWMEKFIFICLSLQNSNRSYENQIDQFHLYFLY